MKNNGASEKHINNNLKAIMNFANHIDTNATFLDIQRKEQVIKFLDTKAKSITEDPEGRWVTTLNHYLSHLKYFLDGYIMHTTRKVPKVLVIILLLITVIITIILEG